MWRPPVLAIAISALVSALAGRAGADCEPFGPIDARHPRDPSSVPTEHAAQLIRWMRGPDQPAESRSDYVRLSAKLRLGRYKYDWFLAPTNDEGPRLLAALVAYTDPWYTGMNDYLRGRARGLDGYRDVDLSPSCARWKVLSEDAVRALDHVRPQSEVLPYLDGLIDDAGRGFNSDHELAAKLLAEVMRRTGDMTRVQMEELLGELQSTQRAHDRDLGRRGYVLADDALYAAVADAIPSLDQELSVLDRRDPAFPLSESLPVLMRSLRDVTKRKIELHALRQLRRDQPDARSFGYHNDNFFDPRTGQQRPLVLQLFEDKAKTTAIVPQAAFWSTSIRETAPFGDRLHWVVTNYIDAGRNISDISTNDKEAELLYSPGQKFVVTKIEVELGAPNRPTTAPAVRPQAQLLDGAAVAQLLADRDRNATQATSYLNDAYRWWVYVSVVDRTFKVSVPGAEEIERNRYRVAAGSTYPLSPKVTYRGELLAASPAVDTDDRSLCRTQVKRGEHQVKIAATAPAGARCTLTLRLPRSSLFAEAHETITMVVGGDGESTLDPVILDSTQRAVTIDLIRSGITIEGLAKVTARVAPGASRPPRDTRLALGETVYSVDRWVDPDGIDLVLVEGKHVLVDLDQRYTLSYQGWADIGPRPRSAVPSARTIGKREKTSQWHSNRPRDLGGAPRSRLGMCRKPQVAAAAPPDEVEVAVPECVTITVDVTNVNDDGTVLVRMRPGAVGPSRRAVVTFAGRRYEVIERNGYLRSLTLQAAAADDDDEDAQALLEGLAYDLSYAPE